MVRTGTPFMQTAGKALLCGSGTSDKELVVEQQRYGTELVASDKYGHTPAMPVAHRPYAVPVPEVHDHRRTGVLPARGTSVEDTCRKTGTVTDTLNIKS